MRIAVLADIHGNLPALEAVLEALEPLHPDAFWIAGDFVGGPQVNATLDRLLPLAPLAIRGNSDTNMLRLAAGEGPREWATSRQFALMRWGSQHLSREHAAWLGSLPEERTIELDGLPPVRIVHGRPGRPTDGLDPVERDPVGIPQAMAGIPEAVLICGHSHAQWLWQAGGCLALNPGSVAADLTGDPRAKYALLEWDGSRWQARLAAAAYDLAGLRRAFEQSGLLQEGGALARGFLLSSESGRDVSLDFFEHAHARMAALGLPASRFIPDEIWDWAEETFDWLI